MKKTAKGGKGMYRLMLEPAYAESVWCKQIVQGLIGELKKRREDHALEGTPATGDTVFIIGSQPHWLSGALCRCNELGIVPILLCNSQRKLPGGRYHCVCSDISGSMRQLTAGLKQRHGNRLALYGINPDSVGDHSRQAAFCLECADGQLFINEGSLARCYERFIARQEAFDAVICTNGFAAISLYRRLRQKLLHREVLSHKLSQRKDKRKPQPPLQTSAKSLFQVFLPHSGSAFLKSLPCFP